MEEVNMAARALYESYSAAEREDIQSLFRSMDRDGDGRISMREFLSYTQNAGDYMQAVFNLFDHNQDGFLQFDELFTLCYIQVSGRPKCDVCGTVILGMYFTCTECRLTNHFRDQSFDLCVTCYRARRFEHPHSQFDDNHRLLLKMQTMLLDATQATPANGNPSPSSGATKAKPANGSSSRGMKDLVKGAFKALALGMTVTSFGLDVMGTI